MPTIRKRGSKWHVQVRRSGHQTQTRTFNHKADADAWGRKAERELDNGELYSNTSDLKSMTTGDLLRRYSDEVTPSKRGRSVERYIVDQLLRHSFSEISLFELSSQDHRATRANSID